MIARYRKAFAAAIGGLTPAGFAEVLALFGVHLNGPLVAAVCAVLAAANTARAKPNTPKPPPVAPVPTGTTTTTTGGTTP